MRPRERIGGVRHPRQWMCRTARMRFSRGIAHYWRYKAALADTVLTPGELRDILQHWLQATDGTAVQFRG